MTTKRKSAAVSTSRSKQLLAPDWAYPTIADWEECADRKAHPAFCAGFRCARDEEQPGDWKHSGHDQWGIGYDMGRTTNGVLRALGANVPHEPLPKAAREVTTE